MALLRPEKPLVSETIDQEASPRTRGSQLEAAGLITLADKGYQGSTYAKIPYRGSTSRNPRKTPTAPTRSCAHPASARTPSSRPGVSLRKLRCCPWRAGQLAKAIHISQIREANAG